MAPMSQEHPHSTPRRSLPKPVLAAFGSTGLLQRKAKGFSDKSLLLHNTPETPLKTERSKFILPLNLTPFALSPKFILSRNNSSAVKTATGLRNEASFDFSGDETKSFEDSFLQSPYRFTDGSIADTSTDQIMSDYGFDQSFNVFVEKSSQIAPDLFMCSPSKSGLDGECDESYESDAYSTYTEPWKSSKVNFFNDWESTDPSKFTRRESRKSVFIPFF